MTRKAARSGFLVLAMLVSLTVSSQNAFADIVGYLTVANQALQPYPGPYAEIEATLNGTAIDFTITGKTVGAYSYVVGDGGAFAFNVNGAPAGLTVTLTGVDAAVDCSPKPSCLVQVNMSSNVSDFGTFDVALKLHDGFTVGTALNPLTFRVTRTAGFTSLDDVKDVNDAGYMYAGHIFVEKDGVAEALETGFAANGTVPDGGLTLILLGGALVGVEALRRRLGA